MQNYTAIIGDIKNSREIDNWSDVFSQLKAVLSEINQRFADDILIPFEPTIGDEFQGALKSPAKAYDVYLLVHTNMTVHIYLGIGVGEIENPQQGHRGGLRGTAFYRAREALNKCKNMEGRMRLSLKEKLYPLQEDLNLFQRSLETIESDWTDRQTELVNFIRHNPDITHKIVAANFNIARPTVTKHLIAAHAEMVLAGDKFMAEKLKAISS
ncbi:SatD family protein [bacterium]|nr:SatD family protein [bacterium]MBU1881071.1 SatD family protein [bacterium]